MVVLALDLGTTTGVAWSSAPGCMVSLTWDCRPKKYEGAGHRYIKFKGELSKLHAENGPIQRVVFEAVRRHIGTDAAHVYGGLMSHLEAWCEENGVPYQGVPVQTIKKFWTGKGNANKDMMIATARERGYEPIDDNEADAIALLTLALDTAPSVAPKRPTKMKEAA